MCLQGHRRPRTRSDKVGLSDPLEARSRNGRVTETTRRPPDDGRAPGTGGLSLLPEGRVSLCSCPFPRGHWRRGEARPAHRGVCAVGKLHVFVSRPLRLIFPSHDDKYPDSHTHTPTGGSGRGQRGDREAFSIRTELPLPPLSPVSLAWEEGTREAKQPQPRLPWQPAGRGGLETDSTLPG